MRFATTSPLLLILSLICLLFLTSCGPEVPLEAEIREKIVGKYCSDDYKLIISKDNYRATKYRKGIVSSAFNIESCKGGYELVYEDNQWVIHFVKDSNPRGIANCKQTHTLWTQAEGYLIGTERVEMKEPIDNTPLIKGSCTDIQ